MDRRVVLTAVGRDRPGIVEEVSAYVLERGGSIEDSRMANLQGQFTIMMLVAGASENLARVEAELDALASVRAQLTPAEGERAPAGSASRFHLRGRAIDQLGLVHEVAGVLRRRGANIESMDTSLETAPVTGAPVFAMDMLVAIPEQTSADELRLELETVCDRLGIDWDLTPA